MLQEAAPFRQTGAPKSSWTSTPIQESKANQRAGWTEDFRLAEHLQTFSALFRLGVSVSSLPPLLSFAKTKSAAVLYLSSRSVKPSELPRQEQTKICRRSCSNLWRCASTFLALRVFPFLC
jgi:hypothetical protein